MAGRYAVGSAVSDDEDASYFASTHFMRPYGVAWMHLDRFAFYEAHLRLRAGVLRLNAAHGIEETPQRGYHETLTHAWLRLVAAARASERGVGSRASDSAAFCDAHPELLDRELPLRFYSRERLFSTEARAVLIAPDRARLPDEL